MTTSLFRQEAIDAHRAKIWGEVTLALPISLTTMTIFLGLCVAGIASLVATGSYARKEHVPGFLAARMGVANIVAPRTGTIAAVHVKEGQFVAQGAPLITINMEQSSESGGGIDSGMLTGLRQQRDRLNEQVGLEQKRASAETERVKAEIDGLSSEIIALAQETKLQMKRTAVAKEQVDSVADLSRKGVITQFELKKREDNYLSFQESQLSLERTIAEKKRNLAQRQNDLLQLPINAERQMSQLQASIGDIDMKIRQTDAQRAYLITAPKAGLVSALQAWVGKAVETNLPQMSIVPEGDMLTAELFIPAKAIGSVAPGQVVHIHYAAFPYQQFGSAEGTVETVSHTLLKPDQSVGPLTFSAPAYRVSVVLKRQSINAYGKAVPLQADMQLDADIIFDRRSLFAWLFDPLLASWRQPS